MYDSFSWCHIGGNPDVTADNGVVTYCYASKDGRIGINDDIVPNYWMACYAFDGVVVFINGETLCSECHALVYLYVVSYYEKYADTYTNFRLDRMRNIRLVNSAREYPDERLDLEQYIKSSFSMFSGKSEYVTLRLPLENKYCNIVIDRFGKSVIMLRDKKSDRHFIIHVPVKAEYPQPFFSWIFSFRGKVEIISPIRLKERYTKVLYESCVQQYMN